MRDTDCVFNGRVDHNYPPPCDVSRFQQELERIAGRYDNGRPLLRVVWGQDAALAREWDCYADGGRGQWRMKYLYSSKVRYVPTADPETGLIRVRRFHEDVGVPRWFVEYYIPPETACLNWQASGVDSDGQPFTDPLPVEGLYEPTGLEIATHDGDCCRAAKGAQVFCYGYYREPGERELLVVRANRAAWDAMPERRPGRQTAEEAVRAKKRAEDAYEAYWRKAGERQERIALDAVRTHAGMLDDSITANQHGKYIFLGGTNKSGTPKTIISNPNE